MLLVIGLAVLAGAFLQSVVGIGLGMLSAPVIALVEPSLVPALPLWLALGIATAMLVGERHHVDWWAVKWALPARVPGTALGAWLVVHFTDEQLAVAVAVVVLGAVALTARSVEVPVNPGTLFGAGLLAGTAGTATSVGGPPVAILFQRHDPAAARATLAVFFVVGTALSLGTLGAVGEISVRSLLTALVMAPLVVAGHAVGIRVRPHVSGPRFRTGVLVVCAASALGLLVQVLR